MKLDLNDVIIKPVVSEKSTMLQEENKYSFYVHPSANRHMVKEAVKKIFNVTPVKVNIMIMPRKLKRVRYKQGYTKIRKKAIVTLAKGETIDLMHMV